MKQAYEYLYKLVSTTLVQIREIFWSLEVCHYMLISENKIPDRLFDTKSPPSRSSRTLLSIEEKVLLLFTKKKEPEASKTNVQEIRFAFAHSH